MLTNFDCNALFVADRRALTEALDIEPEYLRSRSQGPEEVIDYRHWQIPLGRRFRALKLWFVLRSYGLESLCDMVRRHIDWAQWFAACIEASEEWELATPRSLNLVCFYHRAGDAFSEQLLHEVNRSGEICLSHTRLGDRFVLRLCVGQGRTGREHVEQAWRCLQGTARRLLRKL